MSFDLDDEELKATRKMPCNKKKYKFDKPNPENKIDIEKAIEVLKELKDNWAVLLNTWDYGSEERESIELLIKAYEQEKRHKEIYKKLLQHAHEDLKIWMDLYKLERQRKGSE